MKEEARRRRADTKELIFPRIIRWINLESEDLLHAEVTANIATVGSPFCWTGPCFLRKSFPRLKGTFTLGPRREFTVVSPRCVNAIPTTKKNVSIID